MLDIRKSVRSQNDLRCNLLKKANLMSALHLTRDKNFTRVRSCDFSFEILLKLNSDGKTTQELMDMLPNVVAYSALLTCLENLRRLGLIFRVRSGKTYEWWANGEGIADTATLLSDFAAVIPRRDLEAVSRLSEENAFVSRVAGFFSVAGRVDILQAVLHRPLAMREIFERISVRVSPSKLVALLQTLEEWGLISSDLTLVRKEVGGLHSKKYQINGKGRIILDALRGVRPLRDVLKVSERDATLPW
jgi:DNA-binding HxlR family transcriptional regulator